MYLCNKYVNIHIGIQKHLQYVAYSVTVICRLYQIIQSFKLFYFIMYFVLVWDMVMLEYFKRITDFVMEKI